MTTQIYYDCGRGRSQNDASAAQGTSPPCPRGDLKTLVRPEFFCGQTLEAGDLTTLVDWSRDRFGLQRFKTGWGVVCGLQVEVRPGTDNQIVVRPGYAVGLCGADLVVPCEAFRSLADACRGTNGECDQRRDEGSSSDDALPVDPDVCYSLDRRNLVAVDVYLKSRNDPFQPRPSLAHGACTETTDCNDARVRETYTILAERQPRERKKEDPQITEGVSLEESIGAEEVPDAAARVYREWRRGYLECFRHLLSERANLKELSKENKNLTTEMAGRIRSWAEVRRPRAAAFVRDCLDVKKWDTVPENPKSYFTKLLLYVLQDCRNDYFVRRCCTPAAACGVPLARVWMRRRSGDRCSIVYIDNTPPHRRELAPTGPPAPFGETNLSPYIWMRRKEFCRVKKELGLQINVAEEAFDPQTPDDLIDFFLKTENFGEEKLTAKHLREELAIRSGRRLVAHWSETPFGNRIVAFKVTE